MAGRFIKNVALRLVLILIVPFTIYFLVSGVIKTSPGKILDLVETQQRDIVDPEFQEFRVRTKREVKETFDRLSRPGIGRFLECSPTDEILVFVHSLPHQVKERNVVRNTWGSKRLHQDTGAKVFFVVGHTREFSLEDQQTLQWEQDLHNDLIQGDFEEGPDNEDSNKVANDVKSLVWLHWSQQQCPKVPYIMKVNMNHFVDLITLRKNLESHEDLVDSNSWNHTLICKVSSFTRYVPLHDDVRTYCSQDIYLMTNETRKDLLRGLEEYHDYLDLYPHLVSGFLAPLSGVILIDVEGMIWLPEKRFSLSQSPILDMEEEDMDENNQLTSNLWHQMTKEHNLGHIEPVFLQNFSTTSFHNHIIDNPNFCTHLWPDIDILVVVHSNPNQPDFRDAIRKTWGDPRIYSIVKIRPLFFLGRNPDPAVERSIREESQLYQDIVQTDYLDTYKNLTFKAISWMEWVESFCPSVPHLVKSDDDIMIDVIKLKAYLIKMSSAFDLSTHRKFHCFFWRYGRIERNPNHKHFVSKKLYKFKRYPAYCSGSAFILTSQISQVLLDEFRRDPTYLWVDDVFITGILAKRAKVKHHSIASAYALEKAGLDNPKLRRRMIFAHLSGRANHPYRHELWETLLQKYNVGKNETSFFFMTTPPPVEDKDSAQSVENSKTAVAEFEMMKAEPGQVPP